MLIGIRIMGLIQSHMTFGGSLSSWWTKILIGLLLFRFILLQKVFFYLSKSGKRCLKARPEGHQLPKRLWNQVGHCSLCIHGWTAAGRG